MNASSLHLWLGFHSFFKMSSQLQPFPKSHAKGLDLYSSVIRKGSWFMQCSLSLGWNLKDLKLSLWCNSDPVQWDSLLADVFLVELYLFASLDSTSQQAQVLFLNHCWVWQQQQASGSSCKIQPMVIMGQEGCISFSDVSTCLYMWLKSSVNLWNGMENVCRNR